MAKHSILLTGFEPFDRSDDNPSARVVERLASARIPGVRLVTAVLPVAVRRAPEILLGLLKSHRPAAVLMLGEMRGSPCVRVERIAVNMLHASIPDNDGVVLDEEPIDPAGPVAYWSTLPAQTTCDAVRRAGIPCACSFSAGAKKEYEQKLAQWKNGLHGKKVEWKVILDDVDKAIRGDDYWVNGHSSSGFQVSGQVKGADEKALLSLKKGQEIQMSGEIEECENLPDAKGDWFDASSKVKCKFSLSNATLKEGGASTSKPSHAITFLGNSGDAQHVIFCIDASGSMAFATGKGGSIFDVVRTSLIASINNLTAEQDFHVVMFLNGPPIELRSRRLQSTTPENRAAAEQWLNKVVPHGAGSDPVPSLNRSFDILNAAKGNDKIIFLLTDGAFPNNNAVLKCIRQRNRSKSVHVFTYLYGEQNDEEIIKIMKTIATETGGKFKNIKD